MVTLCVKNDYDSVGWSLFRPPPASFSEKEAISTVIRPFLYLFGVIIPYIMEAYMQRPKGNPAVRLYRLPGFLLLLRNVPGSVRKAPVPLQILQDSLRG